ncbi:MAG: hypothetical protein Q4D85_12515 [Corynebacterium sp.]|uniref:hypothetical protein n=1 Tax=Corynebacterium sp. TaxID=1720 RepID=UPI0026DCE014|nr:hypothetical protein [Corynebacterium sp.]MDO5099556.1 hypothetical protein [Corynebacterium sp.]
MLEVYGDTQVSIVGTVSELHELGRIFHSATEEVVVPVAAVANSPRRITALRLVPLVDDTDRLTVEIENAITLVIGGNKHAFHVMGDNLVEYFEPHDESGTHFHLDCFAGDLNETDYGLVFVVR